MHVIRGVQTFRTACLDVRQFRKFFGNISDQASQRRMERKHSIGTVVVGLGIAGNVRVRDLNTNLDDIKVLKLKGYVSRRDVGINGVPKLSLEEALHSPDINAIIICTENGQHEEQARQALQASKHVLVEFPLALSSKAAKELYHIAENKGVILHEENISLLSDSYVMLKELVMNGGPVKTVKLGFEAKFKTRKGGPFLCSDIFLLETLLDLFGALQAESASIKQNGNGVMVAAELRMENGGSVLLNINRNDSVEGRNKTIYIEFEDGKVIDQYPSPTSKASRGLFLQDLLLFEDKILGLLDPEPSKKLTVRAFELADELTNLAEN